MLHFNLSSSYVGHVLRYKIIIIIITMIIIVAFVIIIIYLLILLGTGAPNGF